MAFHMTVTSKIDIPKHLKKVNDPRFWEFGASEWHRLITPYTPMDTGTTSENVSIKGERGSGLIGYREPGAHYVHEGELMVDPQTGSSYAREGVRKVYTGKPLHISKAKHPLATSKWGKAAEPTQKPKLIRSMQRYADSGRLNLNG